MEIQPYSLLSFLFPRRGVPFPPEFIVVKFMRLSDWRGRAFPKFVLEDKNQSGNKGRITGLKPGLQNLESTRFKQIFQNTPLW